MKRYRRNGVLMLTDPDGQWVSHTDAQTEVADMEHTIKLLRDELTAVMLERDEARRLQTQQLEYSIKLQRLIEHFCRGAQLPYPELHHHRLLTAFMAPASTTPPHGGSGDL